VRKDTAAAAAALCTSPCRQQTDLHATAPPLASASLHTTETPLTAATPPTRQNAQAQGRLQRKIASRVRLLEGGGTKDSGRYGAGGRFCRAHRLSPTGLALSDDESTAYTVGKDGVILKWDLETMTRTQLVRYVVVAPWMHLCYSQQLTD
jgi:hypothetical protein